MFRAYPTNRLSVAGIWINECDGKIAVNLLEGGELFDNVGDLHTAYSDDVFINVKLFRGVRIFEQACRLYSRRLPL